MHLKTVDVFPNIVEVHEAIVSRIQEQCDKSIIEVEGRYVLSENWV